METKIKILHLEDSFRDSELIQSMMEGVDIAFEYFLAESEHEFQTILETETIDLILSDYSLPDYNGNEALRLVKEKYPSIPFIFVSGTMGEDSAINALINGATDYVLKNKLERLVPAIKRALHEHELEIHRKLAEDALKESQDMLHKARKLAQLGVWDWNADGDTVTWTEELYQIAGIDPSQPVPLFEEQSYLYTPQSWHLLHNAVENALKTHEPYEQELELIRPDGTLRNIKTLGGTKLDNKGHIIGLFGTVQDITETKRAEQEIIHVNKELQIQNEEKEKRTAELIIANKAFLQSEENFRRSISESPFGIRINSMDSQTIYVNKAFLDIYELNSLEDFKSLSTINRYTPESYAQHLDRKEKRKKGEKTSDYEVSIIRKDGEIRVIKVWRKEILWNDSRHYQIINLDITEQKRTEEALKNSQQQLRNFASHLQDIREQEKIAIAREIHDDLGQILVALKIDLGLFKHEVSKGNGCISPEGIMGKFDDLSSLVDKTIKTTRRIMTGLRPEIIDSLGFIEAARSYILEFEARHHLPCQFVCNLSEINIASQQSVALFRILQEALTNVIKHAKATAVKIKVSIHTHKLILEITDNGIGFDENHTLREESYGMIGMKERIILLEGKLFITGKPGQGTSVRVEIPYCSTVY